MPAPDDESLREAAAAHLARYETTTAGLLRVLDRRIDRWARRNPDVEETALATARAAARRVAASLAASGAVDDARYAARRAVLHARTGRSARASRVLLSVAGVDASLAEHATERHPDHELEAAIALARRRRLGPFAAHAPDTPVDRRRVLAAFGRAGFDADTARRVLALDRDEAERLLERLRARG